MKFEKANVLKIANVGSTNQVQHIITHEDVDKFYREIEANRAFDTLMIEANLKELATEKMQALHFMLNVMIMERDTEYMQELENICNQGEV